MKLKTVTLVGAVAAALLLTGCTSKTVNQAQYSGFLPSYEGLTAVETASGQKALRWVAPGFNVANYDKLVYQPVRFHPTPQTTDRISQQTYDELLKYANTRLSQAFSNRFQLVGFSSGPRTLEFRGAITGVSASTEGVKPYEIIPVALVLAGAMTAAGERDQNSELYLEGVHCASCVWLVEQALAAEPEVLSARAALATGSAAPGVNPAIKAGQAQRDQAMLNLSRTEVRAPVSGIVSQADRLQPGQMMVQGLPGVTIVASNKSWIEANFKETDLAHMRVGQPAEITFDAYPDLKVRGKVSSIGAGTGSEFSVLPAQNANGNWVKVTQRVPVRISITDKPKRAMIAGLSAHVRIDTNK